MIILGHHVLIKQILIFFLDFFVRCNVELHCVHAGRRHELHLTLNIFRKHPAVPTDMWAHPGAGVQPAAASLPQGGTQVHHRALRVLLVWLRHLREALALPSREAGVCISLWLHRPLPHLLYRMGHPVLSGVSGLLAISVASVNSLALVIFGGLIVPITLLSVAQVSQ